MFIAFKGLALTCSLLACQSAFETGYMAQACLARRVIAAACSRGSGTLAGGFPAELRRARPGKGPTRVPAARIHQSLPSLSYLDQG